ncbi:hypothetical protein [Fluviispira sanaruensis]|uniref:Uncharacterized protein n=1 Tax=Fluviispira sanaruensis TaxID=2493639 RepID=A0A4P2VP82_FLUSA|nr:hypothetical protein [Fluviispira sanaruensis]BBH53950.1 hypothetical protein JCM31447_24030 [Fluviispira sanaruensis]
MKFLKLGIFFLTIFSQFYVYSSTFNKTKSFRDFQKSKRGEKKYLLCVHKDNTFDYIWATTKDRSVAYVMGEPLHAISGEVVTKNPLVAELFYVDRSEAKRISNLCPMDYYIQPAEYYPIKLYQMLIIIEKNKYYIFPGHAAIESIEENNELFFAHRG